MALIGYARVSKTNQILDSQLDQLEVERCDRIFTDKITGVLASRPQFDQALEYLRTGDVLVVTKLDRLGRNTKNLMQLGEDLEQRGVELKVLDLGIDTRTPMGRMFFTLMAGFAQLERDFISERTKAGLAAARARGRKGGRKPAMTPAAVKQAQAMYDAGRPIAEIMAAFKVSRPTLYRSLQTKSATSADRKSA